MHRRKRGRDEQTKEEEGEADTASAPPLSKAQQKRLAKAAAKRKRQRTGSTKRFPVFSQTRRGSVATRHACVVNTGPAVGVSLPQLATTFGEYGRVTSIVCENPRRPMVVVSFDTVAQAGAAQKARNRPEHAKDQALVKDNFTPRPGEPMPLLGRWLKVSFAEQRRGIDKDDLGTALIHPPELLKALKARFAAAAPAPAPATATATAAATGGAGVGAGAGAASNPTPALGADDQLVQLATTVCNSDASHASGDSGSYTDPFSVMKALAAHNTKAGAQVVASGLRPRVECPLCRGLFGRGRGLRMHLIADPTGRGHGLSGDLLAATVAAAEAAPGPGSKATTKPSSAAAAATSKPRAKGVSAPPKAIACVRSGDMAGLTKLLEGKQGTALACEIDKNGACALHWAAGSGNVEACKLLVQCGLAVDTAVTKGRRDGRTALHWAARNGHTAVCKWLLSQGVDVNTPTRDGTNAVHWAVWKAHLETCRWLVAQGGKPFTTNSFGCDATHWAALSGSVATCQWLHSLGGADFTVRNSQGHSALHKAAWKGFTDVAHWLVQSGVVPAAELRRADDGGYTVADIARLAGHFELAKWFQQQSSDRGVGVGGGSKTKQGH